MYAMYILHILTIYKTSIKKSILALVNVYQNYLLIFPILLSIYHVYETDLEWRYVYVTSTRDPSLQTDK